MLLETMPFINHFFSRPKKKLQMEKLAEMLSCMCCESLNIKFGPIISNILYPILMFNKFYTALYKAKEIFCFLWVM